MNAPLEHVHPGRTSLMQTARGPLTLQTEIAGFPPEVVTILDFHGRVLKSFRRPLPVGLDPRGRAELANRWHAEAELEVRSTLARRTKPATGGHSVVARLFLAALVAYHQMDRTSARAALLACDALLPGDPRIGAALARVG